ncbi:hypothetical protein BDD12DRAFT_810286 [Trichophaea hybrida]|nr:hypothetical protein BDD12DRAFT_810286 [Trichophaea hybrida]
MAPPGSAVAAAAVVTAQTALSEPPGQHDEPSRKPEGTVRKTSATAANVKQQTSGRIDKELSEFTKQLANQTVAMMDVIRQMLEKMSGNGTNMADKCGCMLNGKEPNMFDGKDPKKFLSWYTRVDNYMGGQLHRIAIPRDVRIIIFSLLEKNALEYAIESCPKGQPDPDSIIQNNDNMMRPEYDTIIKWLSDNFNDTLMIQKLVTEWDKCYQNDEKFQT